MKKQLLILAGILKILFLSTQPATAAKVDTSVSMNDAYRLNTVRNSFTNTTNFSPAAVTYINYTSGFFSDRFNSDKRSKSGLFKSLVSLTTIPLFISPGNNKKTALLALAKEKVLLGSPSQRRFSYPAIAFRIKF
ncbi:MAG TPA: hypothetical protein VG367_16950 [Mucilaginibacter sp.]|jgi:hypothetical protein|nr:hypothetical protein [Mucilaginibacter sp.]